MKEILQNEFEIRVIISVFIGIGALIAIVKEHIKSGRLPSFVYWLLVGVLLNSGYSIISEIYSASKEETLRVSSEETRRHIYSLSYPIDSVVFDVVVRIPFPNRFGNEAIDWLERLDYYLIDDLSNNPKEKYDKSDFDFSMMTQEEKDFLTPLIGSRAYTLAFQSDTNGRKDGPIYHFDDGVLKDDWLNATSDFNFSISLKYNAFYLNTKFRPRFYYGEWLGPIRHGYPFFSILDMENSYPVLEVCSDYHEEEEVTYLNIQSPRDKFAISLIQPVNRKNLPTCSFYFYRYRDRIITRENPNTPAKY